MGFLVPGQNVGDGLLLIYLQILATLTVNVSKIYNRSSHSGHDTSGDSDDDSGNEMDHEESNIEELQVSTSASNYCIPVFLCFLPAGSSDQNTVDP